MKREKKSGQEWGKDVEIEKDDKGEKYVNRRTHIRIETEKKQDKPVSPFLSISLPRHRCCPSLPPLSIHSSTHASVVGFGWARYPRLRVRKPDLREGRCGPPECARDPLSVPQTLVDAWTRAGRTAASADLVQRARLPRRTGSPPHSASGSTGTPETTPHRLCRSRRTRGGPSPTGGVAPAVEAAQESRRWNLERESGRSPERSGCPGGRRRTRPPRVSRKKTGQARTRAGTLHAYLKGHTRLQSTRRTRRTASKGDSRATGRGRAAPSPLGAASCRRPRPPSPRARPRGRGAGQEGKLQAPMAPPLSVRLRSAARGAVRSPGPARDPRMSPAIDHLNGSRIPESTNVR